MSTTRKTPKLRFPEFTDDWEQRKLKEIACKVKNKNKENAISETFTNSAEFGIISQKEFFDHEVASKTNLDSYYIVDIDDFVYNPRISVTAPVGPINRNKLGKAGVMSPLYTVFKTQGVSIDFLEHYFKSTNWHSYMYLNGDSGARSDRFSIKDDVFFDMPIMVPCIKEQMQIGLLFNAISKNITLHQRELDSLKKLKKSLLQKMFPKNGEKIPELRFPEFTGDWEQRKLGEITGKVIGGGTPKTCVSEYWDGDIPWIQSSNVQENEMFDFDIPKSITQEGLEKSAAKLVPENSIAVVTHVGVGKLVFVPFSYTTSQDFTSLSELKTDAQFTCYSLYQRIKNDLHIVQGSAIKGITKDDLLSKEIMVPEIQEQRKIGNYFRKLDNLITLHQRELDTLKKLKKGLLQNMFV